jgi:hypothetical protein
MRSTEEQGNVQLQVHSPNIRYILRSSFIYAYVSQVVFSFRIFRQILRGCFISYILASYLVRLPVKYSEIMHY